MHVLKRRLFNKSYLYYSLIKKKLCTRMLLFKILIIFFAKLKKVIVSLILISRKIRRRNKSIFFFFFSYKEKNQRTLQQIYDDVWLYMCWLFIVHYYWLNVGFPIRILVLIVYKLEYFTAPPIGIGKHLMVCYLVSVPTMQHSTIFILKHRKTKLYINNKRFNRNRIFIYYL